MEKNLSWKTLLKRTVTYILVAALASAATFFFCRQDTIVNSSKLDQIDALIQKYFIGDVDLAAREEAFADAMVNALGDRWSYYIPASEYKQYQEQMKNAYVGIGVTISVREDKTGFDIDQVEPDGPAKEAGILPGDIITHAEGQSVVELGVTGAKKVIRGEEGTSVTVTVLREGQSLTFTVVRKTIQVTVAKGTMLDGNIGLVTIRNFDERCAQETIAAIDSLVQQGAQSLIFDVRNNPGGYKVELVKILDYLLPEDAVLFRSIDYAGREQVEVSDEKCLRMPMAVLFNGNSYSAAEFFAAALEEYDWAVTVGEPTTGKGYFQNSFRLSDGSVVGLSIGKYFTPKGVSLAEVGGLQPKILSEVDENQEKLIYTGLLSPEEDPQIQAAVAALVG